MYLNFKHVKWMEKWADWAKFLIFKLFAFEFNAVDSFKNDSKWGESKILMIPTERSVSLIWVSIKQKRARDNPWGETDGSISLSIILYFFSYLSLYIYLFNNNNRIRLKYTQIIPGFHQTTTMTILIIIMKKKKYLNCHHQVKGYPQQSCHW